MSKQKSVLDIAELPVRTGTGYPKPYDKEMQGRSNVVLGNHFGLTQFGVNITTLEPGAWSSQRHWHENEDELVYALEGEMVIVDDNGRHSFGPGQCAGFKSGNGNGHHIINESNKTAKFLVVGTRSKNAIGYYSDIDMMFVEDEKGVRFVHKDGTSY